MTTTHIKNLYAADIVDAGVRAFKEGIKNWFETNKCTISGSSTSPSTSPSTSDNQLKSDFMKFVFDYNAIPSSTAIRQKNEKKRKRTKIPTYELCIANRANGEQCTRRKKQINNKNEVSGSISHTFCGTHLKGTPNGIIKTTTEPILDEKINIWVADIGGINYYIDNNHNVYHTDDVLKNKHSPRIIAKWTKNNDDYAILS